MTINSYKGEEKKEDDTRFNNPTLNYNNNHHDDTMQYYDNTGTARLNDLADDDVLDVVIIGAGWAGMSAGMFYFIAMKTEFRWYRFGYFDSTLTLFFFVDCPQPPLCKRKISATFGSWKPRVTLAVDPTRMLRRIGKDTMWLAISEACGFKMPRATC
jgi:hypothetical protein